jgi:hypothetical protein
MGIFHRKPDPISDKSKALKAEIARIEAQIKELNSRVTQAKAQPRLRSTAKPHPLAGPVKLADAHEPVFEDIDQKLLKNPQETPPSADLYNNRLGVRRFDLASRWHWLINLFRPPTPSNPKLLNLLAAGNFQGLRPLRYEKRIARNRFIALVVFFLLVLWGIISFYFRHR